MLKLTKETVDMCGCVFERHTDPAGVLTLMRDTQNPNVGFGLEVQEFNSPASLRALREFLNSPLGYEIAPEA
jgi:hypothetical protein